MLKIYNKFNSKKILFNNKCNKKIIKKKSKHKN